MPKRPLKPCAYPGCGKLVKPSERYCEEHRKATHRDYKSRRRDIKEQKMYGSNRWKKIRELKMKECGGLCQECLKKGFIVKAKVVDHIVEVKDGGCEFCLENLQCLCQSCHNKKTARAREGRV